MNLDLKFEKLVFLWVQWIFYREYNHNRLNRNYYYSIRHF